jgi:hypothetical protein
MTDETIVGNFKIGLRSVWFYHEVIVSSPILFDLSLYQKNIPVELREIIYIYFNKNIGFFEKQLYQYLYDFSKYIQKCVLESKNEKEFQLKKHIFNLDVVYTRRIPNYLYEKMELSWGLFTARGRQ